MIFRCVNKHKWRLYFEKERSFFETFDEQFPIYWNWERTTSPNLEAEECIRNAFHLLYADAPNELVRKFLDWTIELIDRGLAENKFVPERSRGAFPMNRGEGRRWRAYAMALRNGDLPIDDLRLAIDDLDEWNERLTRKLWDSVGEAHVLAPARIALIIGDFDRFGELLPFRYPIKWHQEESRVLIEMHESLCANNSLPPGLVEQFVAYFERVRHPEFKPDIYFNKEVLRFELGVLYCKYVATEEPFSWPRVIEEISR